jgi:hypothetical protein
LTTAVDHSSRLHSLLRKQQRYGIAPIIQIGSIDS